MADIIGRLTEMQATSGGLCAALSTYSLIRRTSARVARGKRLEHVSFRCRARVMRTSRSEPDRST